MKKLYALFSVATLVLSFAACSSESSTGPSEPVVTYAGAEFKDIGKVYAGLGESERVVFLLRHAERGSDYSREGMLTKNGERQSKSVGEKLKGDESVFYASSDYGRTQQTCEGIASGRGEKKYKRETWGILASGWFEKDSAKLDEEGRPWGAFAKEAYGVEHNGLYYDFTQRSEEWVDSLEARLPSMKRVNVLVSHDFLVAGMVIYASKKKVDMRYWDGGKWINYLAGVAIIIDSKGNIRYTLVRGLEDGLDK